MASTSSPTAADVEADAASWLRSMFVPKRLCRFALPYLDAVDLKSCGPPGYRIVEELSGTFAIGFKTYIHTPLAKALFLERLSQDGLRPP